MVNILLQKRNKDGTWNLPSAHPGELHFVEEKGAQLLDGIS